MDFGSFWLTILLTIKLSGVINLRENAVDAMFWYAVYVNMNE